jgi:cytochrome b6-f complex iron-sulfur subunit
MRLLDDLAVTDSPDSPTRRRFLGAITWGSLATATLGSLVICARFLWPSVLFELPSRFRAGRLADIARRRIAFLRDRALYVVQDDDGVFAQSAVCTHLGCLTRPNASEDGFFCPCHGSEFSLDGAVVKGPAPRPLPHFQVERRNESLWIDHASEVARDERVPV